MTASKYAAQAYGAQSRPLPRGWSRVPFGQIATLVNGRAYMQEELLQAGTPVLRIQNLNGGDRWYYSDLQLADDKYCEEGDLLFAWSATFGPYRYRGPRAIFHYHIWRVVCGLLLDKDFAYWLLKEITAEIQAAAHGVAMPHMTKAGMEAWPVQLPPLAEQRRIATVLDRLRARRLAGKRALDEVPDLLEKLRQSILAAAFRGDLTKDWRAKNPDVEPAEKLLQRIRAERRKKWEEAELAKMQAKGKPPTDDRWKNRYEEPSASDVTGLPSLPTGWCWIPLPCLGELARGKSKHRPRNDPALFGGAVPFIQTGEVARSKGRILSFSTMYSEFGVAQSRVFPAGTLCITIAANIADTGILGFDACFPDSVVGLVADGGPLMARYIELFLRIARADLKRFAPATAQANINLEILSEVMVPMPPEPERALLVQRVEGALERANRIAVEQADCAGALSRLEQASLSRAFRGELVPQDPNDEPADVMLARLRSAAPSSTSSPTSSPSSGKRRGRPRKP